MLKPGGRAIVIIGDSQIAGELVDASVVTRAAAAGVGLDSRIVESVPLARRSRSFSAAFQRPNKREHVIELTRPATPAAARGSKNGPGADFPEAGLAVSRSAPVTTRH